MKIAIVLLAAVALAGCAGGNGTEMLDAIGRNYGHCERHITYSAGIGVLSPGAQVSGSINCSPVTPVAAFTPLPSPVAP